MPRCKHTLLAIGAVGAIGLTTFATLLGVKPGLPLMFFDNQGTTTYNAVTDAFSVAGTPVAIRFASTDPPRFVNATGAPATKFMSIDIIVGRNGELVGGVPGDDLLVVGEVDSDGNGSIDFSGVLLTGEVEEFGFEDVVINAGGLGTDAFDLRFMITGGSLAPLFAGQDVGVFLASEQSNFAGSFLVSFSGEAKGVLGPIAPLGAGACCFGDDCADNVPADECEAGGGIFQGENTVCGIVICDIPKGACCLLDGACAVVTEAACGGLGGDYLGNDTVCPGVMCDDAMGACCFENGDCMISTVPQCFAAGGLFQGALTECEDVECPGNPQACCFTGGNCAVLAPFGCVALGGDPQGEGTDCVPNICPEPLGACCFADGTCDILMPDECAGQGGFFQGAGTSCDPNFCPQPKGACCLRSGACVVVELVECDDMNGVYQGNFTVCVGNPCAIADD